MTHEEMIAVIQAHKEGKQIQCRTVIKLGEEAIRKEWTDLEHDKVAWNFGCCDYRVKPEPKYRPFKDADECFNALQKHDMVVRHIDGVYHLIVTISDDYIWLGNASCGIDKIRLLNEFSFLDGTPCGIKEE